MESRRILLTGASGLLGRFLTVELAPYGEVFRPDLASFDVTNPATIEATIAACRPDLVVHLAAETRVDHCEENPRDAYRINAAGTAALAVHAARAGARLVTMSTDYVFDGEHETPYREYEPTAPLNEYGRSKVEAERATLTIARDALVIRSASLFGAGGRHFAAAVVERARKGEPVRIVDDQIQSPTWVGHLAPAVARAATSEMRGILHLTANGGCTWFEFGRAILAGLGLKVEVKPISSEKLGRPARRPGYSVLDTRLAEASLGIRMPDWHEGLAAYLDGGAG